MEDMVIGLKQSGLPVNGFGPGFWNPNDPYRVSRKKSWVGSAGGGVKVNVGLVVALFGVLKEGDWSGFWIMASFLVKSKPDDLSEFLVILLFLLLLLRPDLERSSEFSTSDKGLWVFGSMPRCLSFFLRQEFHRFFISLSVLPGSCTAI